MNTKKILTILENYKILTKDIKKIEAKTKYLKGKQKELFEGAPPMPPTSLKAEIGRII